MEGAFTGAKSRQAGAL
ncbi:MAG: hypothetical protein ACLSAF_11235 [Intestinimonas sp.]